MIRKIAHIGIATRSIPETLRFYRLLGLDVDASERVQDQRVDVALLRAGDSALELIQPTDDASPISAFLEKRGPGLHHLTFEVDDIRATLRMLASNGVRLIDEEPRVGAEGALVAFVHPRSTGGVLVELCQTTDRA